MVRATYARTQGNGGGKNWVRFTDPVSGQSLLVKRADVPDGAKSVVCTLSSAPSDVA